MLGKIPHTKKRHMNEFLCFIFLSIIDRYIATVCDLKKRTSSLYFSVFLSFHCPQFTLDLKTEDCVKQRLKLNELGIAAL